MRVYHLLSLDHALDDLMHGRLKVSRFADLNDPFELLSVELSDRGIRRRVAEWRKNAATRYGVLCFSSAWRSPVLWSHYGDKHRGVCLGFDVPDSLLGEVAYLSKRSPLDGLLEQMKSAQPGPLFRTKFEHWRYEGEIRRLVKLDEALEVNGHHFWPFGANLELKEVVAGGRCDVEESALQRALGARVRGVTLTQARLAFTKFEVVTQKLGFQNPQHRRTSQSSGPEARVARLPAGDRCR